METPAAAKSASSFRIPRWAQLCLAFVLAFDVAAFFQWADGAFQSEFGGHPEEAQHYLAGLRTRAALIHAGGGESAAATPGRAYGFPHVLGGWMAVFGLSRISAVLFMAALAAGTATLIFGAVRRELGAWAGIVAAAVWLCAPAVRESYETILPELSGAFVMTAALLLWARSMDDGSLRRAAVSKWFGRAALLGSGCVLAYALGVTLNLLPGDPRAAGLFLKECAFVPGIAVAGFALVGAMFRLRSGAPAGAVWVAMTALVAGVLVARWLQVGAPEVRTLIVATPALTMLAARGAVSLAGLLSGRMAAADGVLPRRKALWLFLLLLLAVPLNLFEIRRKEWEGFAPVAQTLLEMAGAGTRVLVVSDRRGEGMLQSEIAMRDGEGKLSVERGSKTLVEGEGPAAGGRQMERFIEDEHLLAYLTSGRIRYIVLDSAVPYETHADYHDQALRVLEGNVRNFWPVYESPITRDGEPQGHPLRVFRVVQAEGAER